jgi:hypothetical protein
VDVKTSVILCEKRKRLSVDANPGTISARAGSRYRR